MCDNKIYFPLHFDAGNRGCEAIALGTIEILNLCKSQYIALPGALEYDKEVRLNDKVDYYIRKKSLFSGLMYFCFRVIRKLLPKDKKKTITYIYKYRDFLKSINQSDLVFITGGDMLCYGDNEVNYIADYNYNHNIRTVLWGCSFGEENLTYEKKKALDRMLLITARESLTYDYLLNKLKLKNVFLYPDPAFLLKEEKIDLPDTFNSDCLGMNLSNFVGGNSNLNNIFGENIKVLINFLLKNTELQIVLIPHVFWDGQDDRIICREVVDCYNNSRITYLDTEKLSYQQIRYVISKCRFFIGARTHSMISAYSMQVPAIALGYSIKSKGIAKDIGLPDYTVIDYRTLKNSDEIQNSFINLMNHEEEIREIYRNTIHEYIQSAYRSKDVLRGILEE